MLTGMRGKGVNDSIDSTMAHNYWCVTFKDEDAKTWINLVDDCIVQVWLLYIMKLVRLRLYSYVILSMFDVTHAHSAVVRCRIVTGVR